MPRIRSIKPDFFKSEDVSTLPLRARLTWIGLWTQCDDHGRYKDSVRILKGDMWSLDDVSLRDIEEDLAELEAQRRIVRYEVDGKRFLAIVNWHSHQAINRPSKPKHPAPPVALGSSDPDDSNYCDVCAKPGHGTLPEPSLSPHGALTPGGEGKGREGRGGEARGGLSEGSQPAEQLTQVPPEARCPEHLGLRKPPNCGACADARKARNQWDIEQAQRARDGPRCPKHRGEPEHNCARCRSERLAPT